MTAEVRVEQADASRWDDVAEVFGVRGDPSWCWCRYFVTTGEGYLRATAANRAALRRDLRSDPLRPAGLLAYRDRTPVGWLQLGPRTVFPRVTGNRALAAVVGPDEGDETLWRTTCFVVRVGHRRRGVATALLAAGIGFARELCATRLEGHPVDVAARGGKVGGSNLYHGALSTFLAAGFTEVGRTHPTRPVVRRDL